MKYTKQLFEHLLETMLKIRECEEGFVEPILNGEIRCPVHLYSGQEAIATGLGLNLTRDDYVFGNHRSHGHYIAKDGDLKKLVAEVYCRETGCSKGRGGSMHLTAPEVGFLGSAPIVSGTISLALGAALSSSIRNDNKVTVSYFGDGATGEGVLYESLNFASLKSLPIIFACENNFYSTHLSIKEIRVKNNISEVADPFGIRKFRCDGNNILEIYEIAKEAVEYCRQQHPVFIEFLTYRQRGHVGPDDNIQGKHIDIRPMQEVEEWLQRDPIQLLTKHMQIEHILTDSEIDSIKKKVRKEVEEAFVFAHNSPKPIKGELESYVFTK